MRSMKLLQSACMLAVACGVMTTVEAIAQTRDKPGSSQVRKTTTQAKAKAQQRKQANVRHARQGKKKPVAATKKPALSTARKSSIGTAANRPARPLPPPVAWVPPPLGPERFYPNGIPELRPEFMHPERPPLRVEQAANSGPAGAGGQPTEWLP